MPGVENNAWLSSLTCEVWTWSGCPGCWPWSRPPGQCSWPSLTCEHDPDALVAGLAPVHRVSVAVVNTKQILSSISYRYFLVISLLATLKSKMMNIQALQFEIVRIQFWSNFRYRYGTIENCSFVFGSATSALSESKQKNWTEKKTTEKCSVPEVVAGGYLVCLAHGGIALPTAGRVLDKLLQVLNITGINYHWRFVTWRAIHVVYCRQAVTAVLC